MNDGEEQDVDAVPDESWFGASGTDDTDSLSAAGVAQAKDDTPEWLSRFLLTETAEPFNSAWRESVQGAESDSEADLANGDMTTPRIEDVPTETAEPFNSAWRELVQGAESDSEADLASVDLTTPGIEDTSHWPVHALEDEEIFATHDVAGAAEALESDDAFVQATPIPAAAGPLNLKCGHVGYYGILGRRQKVPDPTAIPYRWVCQLIIWRRDSNGKTKMVGGTGVLVSPRHVLTAAHWIKWAEKDNRNLWVTYETTGIRVVPGRYDNDTPLGAAFAKLNMKVAPRWDPRAPKLEHDYALLELETALGDATPSALGGKKLCYWGSRDCPGAVVRAVGSGELDQLQGNGGITAGYAIDQSNTRQYMSRGGITHVNPGARMRMAAHPWEGGSPVWINVRGENQLVGLMRESNVVLRITQPLCDQLRAWMGSQICSTTPARTAPTEIDLFDPPQREAMEEYLFGESGNSEQGQEQLTIEASDDGEIVTIGPEGSEDDAVDREASSGSAVRARILWPALGFPAVIAPGSSSDAETTKCITLLVLSNQRTLTSHAVARHLRCVPWAERSRKHIAEDFFSASDVTILAPKVSFTAKNESQAQLVEFGGTGATAIRGSLATTVTERYAKELPFLHEIRISESRSAKLTDGLLYHLFWNNASTADDAPSDEMAFLLANYAREKRASLGPLWETHERYLMDEFEYEYGSLHRPYCSTTAPRVRAEILHPLFVDRGGRPTLKVGHLTDLHVDVRNDVYEENVKAREYQLKAKAAKQMLSSDEQAQLKTQLNTLALFNNWNKSVVALYNDAKQGANAILLTGDLIDYGRAHWGQDAGPHLQDNDLYTADRNWFLFSYLLSSGAAYTKPVYTILGNHDWRINPYPPFAVGAPSSENFFFKERPWKATVEKEKKCRKLEGERANEALRTAHGDGHKRKFSYAAKAENALELLLKNTGDAVKALVGLMLQRKDMNVEDTPAETTVKSVEWYLLSINPFLDYAFTLPNQHRVLMLDWAEKENVLFPILSRGRSYPYLLWQAGEAADPGPKARSCLTSLQQDLVSGFLKLPGRSKIIGMHAPPIGPYPDWTDKDMLEGRTKYGKEKVGKVRGRTDFVTKKPDGTTEPWYGHPLFATRPKSGIEGVTADYGSFENQRDWFIENVGDGKSNVRVILSGHIHRNGAYVVHLVKDEMGPTLAGERLVYRVKTPDASNAAYPAVSRTPQGKCGPLYVNTTSAGPNGNYHPVADVDAKRYPGSARVHLAENGTIELVQFRILGKPGGQRIASPGFAELKALSAAA
jgi:V8-like Glu-specific endopeptidase